MSANAMSVCAQCGSANRSGARYCNECGSALDGPHADVNRTTESERKVATVLFADIANSTQAVSGLDAESAMRRINPLVDAMAAAVREHGGTVHMRQGDGIMASFGAADVSEDHALAACRAGFQIRTTIPQSSAGLAVRVGIHTGEMVVSWARLGNTLSCDLTGPSVHLANRLQRIAEPNTVLVSAETHRYVRTVADWRARGRLTLRGFAGPVEAWELVNLQSRSRWAMREALGLSPFQGRGEALNLLRELLAALTRGRGGAVIVRGDPGVGKSRLVHEVLAPDVPGDCSLWEAETELPGRHSPYAVCRTLLRQWLGASGNAARDEVSKLLDTAISQGDGLPAALHLPLKALLNLETQGSGWDSLDPLDRRKQMAHAFHAVCLHQARTRALIILVDDLQWCDTESLTLLAGVAREAPAAPLALLLTTRSAETVQSDGLFADATWIELEEFTQAEADKLFDALLGQHDSLADMKQRLSDLTGRLPLFLEEAVRHLIDQGTLVGEPGFYRWSRDHKRIETPRTVHALATSRIGGLPADVRATALAASIVGRLIPVELLTQITGLSDHVLRAHLAELGRRHVLFVDELYDFVEFRHEFLREAAESMLLRDARRELHVRTLRAGERFFADRLTDGLDFLAHHADAAQQHEDAVRYYRLAAEHAVESSSYRAALECCQRALVHLADLPPTRENRVAAIDIRFLLRVAVGATSDFQPWIRHLGEAIAIAEEIGDTPRRVLACVHRTWALNFAGSADEAMRSGEAALALARSHSIAESETLARFALGQAAYAGGAFRKAVEVLGPAIDWLADGHVAERIGTTGTTYVLCLMMRANACASMACFDEANADLAIASDVTRTTGRVYDEVSLCYGQGLCAVYRGDFAAALPPLQRGYDTCHRVDINLFLPLMAGLLGTVLTAMGRIDEADNVLSTALHSAETVGHGVARTAAIASLATVRLAQGRANEALALAGEARAAARERGHRGVEISATRVLAQCFVTVDPADLERPGILLREAVDLAEEIEAIPSMLSCLGLLIPLLVRAGRTEEAGTIAQRAAELATAHHLSLVAERFRRLAEPAG